MEVAAKVHHHQPLCLSLYHHRPSFSRPIASLSRTPPSPLQSPPPSSLKSSLLIKSSRSSPSSSSSSSFSDPPFPSPKTPKPKFTESLNRFPFSLLKASAIASIAAAAIVLAGHFNLKPPIAAAISPPPTIEKQALSDVEALTNLMEVKTKNRKDLKEAIGIVERLIELEPNDIDLQLQKSNLHCDSGELEMAKLGFNEVIKKDPFKVPAYHGLMRVALQEDPSGGGLGEIEKKVRKAMELCQRKKRKDDLKNFKLLMAPIRVIEGKYNEALKICEELVEEEPTKNILPYTYLSQFMFSIGSRNFRLLIAPILFFEGKHNEALKVYQELVNEEPRDFWPYLYQGIIYTSLKKTDEATKLLHKYLEARS